MIFGTMSKIKFFGDGPNDAQVIGGRIADAMRVTSRIVIPFVVGSSPISHPIHAHRGIDGKPAAVLPLRHNPARHRPAAGGGRKRYANFGFDLALSGFGPAIPGFVRTHQGPDRKA